MTPPTPILEYSPNHPPPRTLTLEATDCAIRVIFPVGSKWSYWLPIVGETVFGIVNFAIGFTAAWFIRHTINTPGIDTRPGELEFVRQSSMGGLFWWTGAAYSLWKYRRWGQVPRILTATHQSLIYSKLGFWAMRQHIWLADEIKEIRFCPIKINLNPKSTAANLYIYHRNKRWPKHFRLSSANPELPALIAKELAAMLGHPLTTNTKGSNPDG
jgi:hypothetical protein